MLFKIKQNLCANGLKGPLKEVQTKNNLKENDFKQFTRWKSLPLRNKFPGK